MNNLAITYPSLIAHNHPLGYHLVFKRPANKDVISHLFINYREAYTSTYALDENGCIEGDPIIKHLTSNEVQMTLSSWKEELNTSLKTKLDQTTSNLFDLKLEQNKCILSYLNNVQKADWKICNGTAQGCADAFAVIENNDIRYDLSYWGVKYYCNKFEKIDKFKINIVDRAGNISNLFENLNEADFKNLCKKYFKFSNFK